MKININLIYLNLIKFIMIYSFHKLTLLYSNSKIYSVKYKIFSIYTYINEKKGKYK